MKDHATLYTPVVGVDEFFRESILTVAGKLCMHTFKSLFRKWQKPRTSYLAEVFQIFQDEVNFHCL